MQGTKAPRYVGTKCIGRGSTRVLLVAGYASLAVNGTCTQKEGHMDINVKKLFIDHNPDVLRWQVYAIKDPRDGLARYIGQTIRPKQRINEHLRGSHWHVNPSLARWLEQMRLEKVEPHFDILGEFATQEEADIAEQQQIVQHNAAGHPLTNLTLGGTRCRGVTKAALRTNRDWIELGYKYKALLWQAIEVHSSANDMFSKSKREVRAAMSVVEEVRKAISVAEAAINTHAPHLTKIRSPFRGTIDDHFATHRDLDEHPSSTSKSDGESPTTPQ